MATDEPPPTSQGEPEAAAQDDDAGTAVAVLLASAAVIAAAIGGWAAASGDRGSDEWHRSIRQHVKQAAGTIEDVRFVYEEEAPLALQAAAAEILAEEYRGQARRSSGVVRELLLIEARAQDVVVETATESSELVDPRYRTADGGFDVPQRLADNRAENPDLLTIDPRAVEDVGTEGTLRATLLTAMTVAVALAFVAGALVYGFPRWRRSLVVGGYAFVVLGLIGAAVVGVVV